MAYISQWRMRLQSTLPVASKSTLIKASGTRGISLPAPLCPNAQPGAGLTEWRDCEPLTPDYPAFPGLPGCFVFWTIKRTRQASRRNRGNRRRPWTLAYFGWLAYQRVVENSGHAGGGKEDDRRTQGKWYIVAAGTIRGMLVALLVGLTSAAAVLKAIRVLW